MGKNRKWQFACIIAVTILTVYNIIPSLFYYLKPLQKPIDKKASEMIALGIEKRIDLLEDETEKWIESFCNLIHVKPSTISLDREHPQWISVTFSKQEDATTLRNHLARSGSLISFSPSKLRPLFEDENPNTVSIIRQIPIHLQNQSDLFSWISKQDPKYSAIVQDLDDSDHLSGALVLHLDRLAEKEIQEQISSLQAKWSPKHPDLQNISIVDAKGYEKLSPEEKSICLIVLSPLHHSGFSQEETDSLYILAKGFERIGKNYEGFSQSPLAQTFSNDLRSLQILLYQLGFAGAPILKNNFIHSFGSDFLFEKKHFAEPILTASRELFRQVKNNRYAVLGLSNVEQRIIAENKIDAQIHRELIQWNDDYLSSQVNLNPKTRFDVPKPTHNVFWNNLCLTFKKMVRGDPDRIIRWGLDLSGGKTVEIELRDGNHQVVRSESDLKQGMNELYSRVNKMGLSEVSIRQIGEHIVLDFPGSQSLSASELIKASTMQFHIVNEKFSPQNPRFGQIANQFLQKIWDEASALSKTDSVTINEIAKRHLREHSEEATLLRENGLQFGHEETESLDDSISKIVVQRGSSPSDWHGMTHPLLITFHNSALEGAYLENVHASYDPTKGNYLSFNVAPSFQNKQGVRINPQNQLHSWTSRYSKESIGGTPHEIDSLGRGWRMAVVLNDTVISSPTLDSALKESAMISGHFSQAEAQRLSADLKAGSMTFTPHILSEKNVSPELGQTDRTKGIVATFISLLLVIGCMISYYRYAGLIASVAVIFNLLILWATLQNLGAALTLAGIAGIILTVGMSIDANVLVFERIKEEFALTRNIKSAIESGYKKAFSAILDSNITTIIAALILLNFDAGPIKSFAVNLIIGIVSSMFTALFMTRFYFTIWAENPKNRALKMANWIQSTTFEFLKKTKIAFVTTITLIMLGTALLFSHFSSIFGLDFTGGYSAKIELTPNGEINYAEKAKQAFLSQGAQSKDFIIQEMNPSNQLRILFGESMEQAGKPFFGLPLEIKKENANYPYEENPRLSWIVNALHANDLPISKKSLETIHSDWGVVSGQMSKAMRNHAILGFILSFIGIFIYLAFRFEYKFAAAALVCLIHDLLITLAVVGLLHAFGVPIQIDLITIAALMTAIGYSLNDTIIIFDRIREEIAMRGEKNLSQTIDHALNFTLSRTMITSGSTLLVLIALLFLGGSSIFGFALVMTIGVIFGTLSSWFIAAPLMLYFHKKEEKKLTFVEKT